MENSLEIKAKDHNYQVIILREIKALIKEINVFSEAILIVDEYIYKNYKFIFENIKKKLNILAIESKEKSKNLSSLEVILKYFQCNNVTKSTRIIGIGGGIIQDITFFVSHIYYRGLEVYFIPTTLLAMCDSCIGSKCGLNFNGFKNQIGVFHPPKKVIICLDFLDSLPKEAVNSGYGEILKFMLIAGKQNFKGLKFIFSNLSNQRDNLHQYIYESLNIKKVFIEEDEFDLGMRRLLNYGHTFGHALELASDYAIAHGIAVARGIDIVNYIALRKEFISNSLYQAIHTIIKENFYSDKQYGINQHVLVDNTRRDKKSSNGMLNLVFLKNPGNLFIHPIQFDSELSDILGNYLQENPS